MKNYRNSLTQTELEKMSDDVFCNLKKILKNFCETNYFIYLSFNNEVQTQKIINFLLLNKKNVFVPKIKNNFMLASRIDEKTTFEKNKFGILEPTSNCEDINNFVAIIPCLAVDKFGNRVGYGGGYYDKFLQNKCAKKIAICFDNQITDCIPAQNFDIKMDYVISNRRIIKI